MRIPLRPRATEELIASVSKEKLPAILRSPPVLKGQYVHWDKLRHLEPPTGLTHDEWWLGIKLARSQLLKPVPLRDKLGNHFHYGTPDPVLRHLHEIDQLAGGQIQISEAVTNPATRDRYIVNSLIDEAINSSQLEGASTTVDVAKQMLRTGRQPTDRSEQMIVNNYAAMRHIRQYVGQPMSQKLVFAIHRILTKDTLDDPTKAGCFRSEEDASQVEDGSGTVLHIPPSAVELPARMEVMCAFANEEPDETFLHPVVRALILHFWLGFDHPFVDGNGRTARALFYWSMLSQGYWLAEYLSISRILKKAPSKYARSFLYTETDENDLTYFLAYHLGVVRRSIDDLRAYLERKTLEVHRVELLLKKEAHLNHRQLALLGHALRHPGARYTIESHRSSHNVAYQTARTDLLELASEGLLLQWKRGRSFHFSVPTDLKARLQ